MSAEFHGSFRTYPKKIFTQLFKYSQEIPQKFPNMSEEISTKVSEHVRGKFAWKSADMSKKTSNTDWCKRNKILALVVVPLHQNPLISDVNNETSIDSTAADNQTLYEIIHSISDAPTTDAVATTAGSPSHTKILAIVLCSTCVLIVLIAVLAIRMRRKIVKSNQNNQNSSSSSINSSSDKAHQGHRQRRESEFQVTSGSGRHKYYVNEKGRIVPVTDLERCVHWNVIDRLWNIMLRFIVLH